MMEDNETKTIFLVRDNEETLREGEEIHALHYNKKCRDYKKIKEKAKLCDKEVIISKKKDHTKKVDYAHKIHLLFEKLIGYIEDSSSDDTHTLKEEIVEKLEYLISNYIGLEDKERLCIQGCIEANSFAYID